MDCWTTYSLAGGETGAWSIGPLSLWITRLENEWQLTWESGSDPMDPALRVEVPARQTAPPSGSNFSRYGVRKTSSKLVLAPVLPDRPIVVRPVVPFYIPSHEETTLYVSTPLWVRMKVGESPKTLSEIPAFRLSDTWFGLSTTEGEICYATRTAARLRAEDLPSRPHRAITSVTIRNRSESALLLERLKLPVPFLSLFRDGEGHLYTESISLEREENDDGVRVKLGKGPHHQAGDAAKISEPRIQIEKSFMVRAFHSLFG